MEDKGKGDESEAVNGIPTTLEHLEYEALAEKKRKALADSQRDGSEKRATYDVINISNSTSGEKEFKDLFFPGRLRKKRKNEKKGRRKGSNKEVPPEIRKRWSEALFLHTDDKDSEALPILLEIMKEAPTFDQPYYLLSRVAEKLGKTDSASTEALKIAANIKGPKSPFWILLYERANEQGDMLLARNLASKAIQADPENIDLKHEYVELCLNAGKYKEAAETYEQIFRREPEI